MERDTDDINASGAIPFIGDRRDEPMTSAEADRIAAGVDPEELGLDDDATPADAEEDPEATP
jgi:hypothetical protein